MILEKIASQRSFQNWPSYDLVYEWEDILVQTLSLSLYNEPSLMNNKFFKRISGLLSIFLPSDILFRFEMNPSTGLRIWNKENVIPCIIDFFIKDHTLLKNFEKNYRYNPIVFISSLEVFEYLKKMDIQLNIQHLPLSISDKYKLVANSSFEKKYDLVLMGRQNPILEKFVYQYASENKDFKFVFRKMIDNKFLYYVSDGECLGDINSREKYISLMKQSKCGLYSTPGIDGGESRTNGFSQVTPRFLELLACGCHVIARYKENEETNFYHLDKFSKSIQNYSEFKLSMDNAREQNVDLNLYSKYLNQHYTSVRGEMIKNIMKTI